MSSREDDQVLAALKTELLAFLFDKGGPQMPAPQHSVADIVADIVADRMNDQLHGQLVELRKSVLATLRREQEPPTLTRHLANPLFIAALVVALLSVGVNIGLGIALVAKPSAKAPTEEIVDLDASASASCAAVSSEIAGSAARSPSSRHGGAGSSAASDSSKAPDC